MRSVLYTLATGDITLVNPSAHSPRKTTRVDGVRTYLDAIHTLTDNDRATVKAGGQGQQLRLVDGALEWVARSLRVPSQVQMVQLREQLIRDGLKASVEAAVAAIPDPVQKEIINEWWEYATVVRRTNDKVAMVAAAINVDDATLDQIFINAKQL